MAVIRILDLHECILAFMGYVWEKLDAFQTLWYLYTNHGVSMKAQTSVKMVYSTPESP
jgi:hypothetical protein